MSLLLLFQAEAGAYSLALEGGSVTIAGGDIDLHATTISTEQGGGILFAGLPLKDRRVRRHYILACGTGRIAIRGGELLLSHHMPRDPELDDDEVFNMLLLN